MADYYTSLSFEVPVPKNKVGEAMDFCQKYMMEKDEEETFLGVEVGQCEEGIWVCHGEGGYAEGFETAEMIKALLARLDSNEVVSFQWSYDCNKPRLDAFGGGAAVVSRSEVRTMYTGEWVRDTIEQVTKELEATG